MDLELVSLTHAGRRGQNQDTVIADVVDTPGGQLRIAAVLDGMGGMKAGDRASQLASDIFLLDLRQTLRATRPENQALRAALTQAMARAHQAVYAEGRSDPAKRGMGTTLVAALEMNHKFIVANVGDSRAYLWNPLDRSLKVLTRDHSLREEAVRLGAMTPEEAAVSPLGHALTRSIGSSALPEIDLFPEPDGWHELPTGGALLLCSDGLQDGLDDLEIAECMSSAADVRTAAINLVRAAYHGGSRDNISVVLLCDRQFKPVAPPTHEPPPIDDADSRVKVVAPHDGPMRPAIRPKPPQKKPDDYVPWWMILAAAALLAVICAAIFLVAESGPTPIPITPELTATPSPLPATPPPPVVPGPELNPFAPETGPPPAAPPPVAPSQTP